MTDQTPEKQNGKLHAAVLKKIEAGAVHMKPKWHFALTAWLAGLGGIILGLAIIFVGSFIVFIFRESGAWHVPGLAPGGWVLFFISLPWIFILVGLVFIIILEILVRKYAFAYRQPLLYSFIAIALLVILGSWFMARTSFHARLSEYGRRPHPPLPMRLLHNLEERQFKNIHRGRIEEVTLTGFILGSRRGERIPVVNFSSSRSEKEFAPGDHVLVIGARKNGTIHATTIRLLPPPPERK